MVQTVMKEIEVPQIQYEDEIIPIPVQKQARPTPAHGAESAHIVIIRTSASFVSWLFVLLLLLLLVLLLLLPLLFMMYSSSQFSRFGWLFMLLWLIYRECCSWP